MFWFGSVSVRSQHKRTAGKTQIGWAHTMALFQFRWLRKFVRRNTHPIEYHKALFWKEKMSIAYMLIAWNAFGLVCYMIYSGRADWAKYYGVVSEEEAKMSPGLCS